MKIFFLLLLLAPIAQANAVVVNDVTRLNPIEVERVVTPRTIEEVQQLVGQHKGAISIGGGRYSMGGQIGAARTLHLDMRQMDKVVAFSPTEKWIVVQPGITWRKIQQHIDAHNLSLKIMQSYASFSVGGSLSVNVHGRYVGLGPLASSIRHIKIVTADGGLIQASPKENSDIFWGAIGGYGSMGVIVEAGLDLADNVRVERSVKLMHRDQYVEHFKKDIRGNKDAIFHNGDIYPPKYTNVVSLTWSRTEKAVTVKDRLMPVKPNGWLEHAMLFGLSEVPFAKNFREKVMDPRTYRQPAVVWRNYEASYDVSSLEPQSRDNSTYVLQEYFVPVAKFEDFAKKMAAIFIKHDANILNVSIRHAYKDPGSVMAWAREEVFAFVVYYKQGVSQAAQEKVGIWTRELIDAVLSTSGTYYLPYQLHATVDQFRKAYPRYEQLAALKRKYDPGNKFRNKFLNKYLIALPETEKRPEGQTFLTLPEWFVVFTADEYADHLKHARPSSFPYFSNVNQFWRIYLTAWKETRKKYPMNWEYHSMLAVVGLSHTAENWLKGLYEMSIGWCFEKLSDKPTAEELFLTAVADEYAKFLHQTPWYQFPFNERLKEFWKVVPREDASFLRQMERRIAGTLELGGKAGWAWVIKKVTGASLAPDELTLQAVVDGQAIELPRYEAFTKAALEVVRKGGKFDEISGNKRIVATFIADQSWSKVPEYARVMLEWPILTQPGKKRIALVTEVSRLHDLVMNLESEGPAVDHIFDY